MFVLEFFLSQCIVSILTKELKRWVSVPPSPSVISLCFGTKSPGHTCDTNRHQTRQCTQTKTDVGWDVLFQYYACRLLSAVGYAFQASFNQLPCDPAWSKSRRCE